MSQPSIEQISPSLSHIIQNRIIDHAYLISENNRDRKEKKIHEQFVRTLALVSHHFFEYVRSLHTKLVLDLESVKRLTRCLTTTSANSADQNKTIDTTTADEKVVKKQIVVVPRTKPPQYFIYKEIKELAILEDCIEDRTEQTWDEDLTNLLSNVAFRQLIDSSLTSIEMLFPIIEPFKNIPTLTTFVMTITLDEDDLDSIPSTPKQCQNLILNITDNGHGDPASLVWRCLRDRLSGLDNLRSLTVFSSRMDSMLEDNNVTGDLKDLFNTLGKLPKLEKLLLPFKEINELYCEELLKYLRTEGQNITEFTTVLDKNYGRQLKEHLFSEESTSKINQLGIVVKLLSDMPLIKRPFKRISLYIGDDPYYDSFEDEEEESIKTATTLLAKSFNNVDNIYIKCGPLKNWYFVKEIIDHNKDSSSIHITIPVGDTIFVLQEYMIFQKEYESKVDLIKQSVKDNPSNHRFILDIPNWINRITKEM